MGVVVQKYGGSSVADVEKIKAVARRIVQTHRSGNQVVAVVSAMGKKTDELLTLANQVTLEPGRRELDMLVSVGERISMTLLSMAVSELGCQAISFTGSQSGIITDTSHFNANILEVRPARIVQALQAGNIVIVAGYQGVSVDKEVTTLGRGGTDTTAVALAAALEADYCEICSDVDGVYSSDPRVVSDASHIDALSYDEMLVLARRGAKVLAAEAVEYAKRHGIVIRAAATFADTGNHTQIRLTSPKDGAVAVTGDDCLATISWTGDRESLPRFWTWWESAAVPAVHLSVNYGDVCDIKLAFRVVNVPNLQGLLEQAQQRLGPSFLVDLSWGSVTLVGRGLNLRPQLLHRALDLLSEGGVSFQGLELTGNELTVYIPREQVKLGQKLLHEVIS